MSRMRDPKGPKVRFEITEDRPEDDPQRLAICLAEAFTKAAKAQRDCETFRFSAKAERTKAAELRDIIFKLKEREKNPQKSKRFRDNCPLCENECEGHYSRMDPLNEYHLGMCESEFLMLKKRAQELQEQSDDYAVQADDARREADNLQRKIAEANAKLSQQK